MQRRGPAIDDTRPVWRSMLAFLIPLMLSNVLQSASGTFSSIFLGRMIGVGALAAASSIFPMLFFLISFFIGIASASTVLIGQAYGAQDQERMDRVAGTTLAFALLLGIVFGAIGLLADRAILTLIATPPDIFNAAAAYARVWFVTLPLLFVYIGYTTFLRGVGDTRTPFVVLIFTTLLAIVLTPLLIRGLIPGIPPLGIIAAPIATMTSNALGTAGLLIWLERRDSPLAIGKLLQHLRIHVPTLLLLIRIGIPTGVQMVMVSLAEIAVISFVNRFGSAATAAYGAVNQIVSYVQFPAVSIGIAASIFGAHAIGAGRLERLGRIVRAGVGLNYAIGGILIGLCYLFARELLGLFLTQGPTLEMAHDLLAITLWSYVIFGNTAVLSGLMRSSGTVLWPTLLSIVAIWGVEVPVAWALSHGPLQLRGVWVAYPVAFAASLLLQSCYYFMFWKRRPIAALVPRETT